MKVFRLSKWIVLCLAFLMVFATACSSGGDKAASSNGSKAPATSSGSAADGNKPTITLAVSDNGQVNWSSDLFIVQKMEEAIGANIQVQPIPTTDFGTKRNAMMASGDIPDLMFHPDSNSYKVVNDLGPKGTFYAVDTVMDKMPNLKRWVDKYPEFTKYMTASDGHIYGIPKVNTFDMFDWGLTIRADLLAGTEMPAGNIKTLDDLEKALTIIKDKTGSAPWVAREEKNGENRFLPALVPVFGTGLRAYYNPDEDKFKYGPLDANFKTMIEYLSKLYGKGLIYKDIFTMGDDQFDQALAATKGSFFIDNMAKGGMIIVDGKTREQYAKEGKIDFQVILPPEVNGQRHYGTMNSGHIDYNNLWTINAKTEHLDKVLALIDWAYSDVGNETLIWGEEGKTFTKTATGHTYVLSDEEEPKVITDYGLYHGGWNIFLWTEEIFNLGWRKYNMANPFFNTLKIGRDLYNQNKVVPPQSPAVNFTEDQNNKKNVIEPPLFTYTDENVMKFIMGVRPMSEWDKFLDELKGMNVEQLMTIYNEAYKGMK